MKKFAQILGGKLHWKFEQESKPEFAPDIEIVEITGVVPEPQEGWGWDGQAFVAPLPPALPDLKAAKNAEINADRLAANRGTFTHAGKLFACDELSRSDIDGTNGYVALYGALPPGWVGGWKTVENDYYAITDVGEWKAFYTSMFATGAANFAKAQALKTALADATTAAQVAAIVW